MKNIKIALFAFICSIGFSVAQSITGVQPIAFLTGASSLVCIMSLVAWLCRRVLDKFKHSFNIIAIIIFAVLAVFCSVFSEEKIYIQSLHDFANMNYMTIAWIISVMGCCVSVLILIGQLIFGKKEDVDLGDAFHLLDKDNKE